MESNYWEALKQSRLSRRRTLATTGAGAVAVALATACGSGSSKSSGPASSLLFEPVDSTKGARKGGVFLAHQRTEVQNFDPLFTSAPTQPHGTMVYNRLVRAKPGYLQPARSEEIMGDLANSWELSPDKLQLTMKLQPNAKWHNLPPVNGRAVTAEDVTYTWQRFVRVATNRTLFANSANPFAPIETIRATDNRTIVIKTVEPYAALLALLSYPQVGSLYILPTEAESGFDVKNRMIGTGHFYQAEHQPSVRSVYKRNDQFWESSTYVDEVQLPILTEYSAGLAQFKAGKVWDYPLRGEDVLPTKRDDPRLLMAKEDLTGPLSVAFFGWNPAYGEKTPFRDKRLRQAFSMSWDRDGWIDNRFNVSQFQRDGLPMETSWNTALRPLEIGWWLDPRSKEFGPNAKYYEHNIAEAKKLMAAAGYGGGLTVDAAYVTTGQYGPSFNPEVEILLGFLNEAGFKPRVLPVNWNTDWRPKYADNQGDFEGVSFRLALDGSHPAVPEKLFLGYHHQGGLLYTGFFSDNSSFQKGDPRLEDIITRARREFDGKKQKELVNDFQRMEAEAQYRPRFPGVATTFLLRWPAIQNDLVYRGDMPFKNVWLDPAKAPLA